MRVAFLFSKRYFPFMKHFILTVLILSFSSMIAGCAPNSTLPLEERSTFSGEKEPNVPYAEPSSNPPNQEPAVQGPTTPPPTH